MLFISPLPKRFMMVKKALMVYKTAKVPKILPTIRVDRLSKNGPE